MLVALADLIPHPLNDNIYGRVSADDPEVVRLADDIRRDGILEPLVITADNYILSGHRRRVAASLAGLNVAPCRRTGVRHDDPDAARLLCEFNNQRVKRVDQLAAEEIIAANPEEAERAVRQYRVERAKLRDVDLYRIEGQMARPKTSKAKRPFMDAILAVLQERKRFWPLTVRQVHYALLNRPPLIHASKPLSVYRNDRASYKALSDLGVNARLRGSIPWKALHDPTRDVQTWTVHPNVRPFIKEQLGKFLQGYWRDLQASQPNHLEIVIEKNTAVNIVAPVASEYCIPVTPERGQCSLPPRHEMAERFRASGKAKLIVLILGDFDPDGDAIINAFLKSMRDDFSVRNLEPIHVALTHAQTQTLRLPPAMQAKKKSASYKKFVRRYGADTYELEAVPPEQLQQLLRDAVDSVMDVKAYNAELDAEKRDVIELGEFHKRIKPAFADVNLPAA